MQGTNASAILRASDRCESNFDMAQLTSTDLIKILVHVTLILVIPMVGGAVVGIVIDRIFDTSPIFVFGGFGAGNIIAVIGILVYIRTHAPASSSERDEELVDGRDA